MIKKGSIVEFSNLYPIAMFDVLVKDSCNGKVWAAKFLTAGKTSLLVEPERVNDYRVIGSVQVGRKYSIRSGRRFCNCIISLNNGASLPVSVLIQETLRGPEITSVFEIRRLAFCNEEVEEFLKRNLPKQKTPQLPDQLEACTEASTPY